jgi:predicted pyridoxine 5'-phosphate oxidase superfamily flavin-nucleotide-binding protein
MSKQRIQYLSTQSGQASRRDYASKLKDAGAEWVAAQKFWLFGTALYADGSEVTNDEALRDAKHYFNVIDRQLLSRRDYNEGRRLQRLVFLETGKLRANTHLHFFIKGTHLRQYRHIKSAAEENWTRRIRKASNVLILDNIEYINERKGYCWKEFDGISSDALLVECCHLSDPIYT